jgi:DNA-binding MarR family transcriptional regulator
MPQNIVLHDFIPYLLNRAGVRIGLSFSRDIAPYNITLPMWRVLAALWQNGDQRLSDLSAMTSIDVSTLSRLLVNMQRRRLIVRRRSGLDARALNLHLTARGCELTQKIIPIALHYEQVAIAGLSEAEVKLLKRLLAKLYANIETFDHEHSDTQPTVDGFSLSEAREARV